MKNILIALACLISVSVFGQDTIPMIAYWDNGQTHNFKVTKITTLKDDNGFAVTQDTLSYIANFEVIDSIGNQYTVKWSYEYDKNKLTHPNIRFDPFLANYDNVEVIYTTDEFGILQDIQNWQSISHSMKTRYDNVIDILVDESDETREQILERSNAIQEMYENPEMLLFSVFKELIIFHYLFGFQFTIGEVIEYQDELPNPLGSTYPPLLQDTEIYISNYDTAHYFLDVTSTAQTNEQHQKLVMASFMKQLSENLGYDISDEVAKSINLSNNSFWRYHLSGVPLYVSFDRKTSFGSLSERRDIFIIELLN